MACSAKFSAAERSSADTMALSVNINNIAIYGALFRFVMDAIKGNPTGEAALRVFRQHNRESFYALFAVLNYLEENFTLATEEASVESRVRVFGQHTYQEFCAKYPDKRSIDNWYSMLQQEYLDLTQNHKVNLYHSHLVGALSNAFPSYAASIKLWYRELDWKFPRMLRIIKESETDRAVAAATAGVSVSDMSLAYIANLCSPCGSGKADRHHVNESLAKRRRL